jgi:tripartite-type tricarboxylate transporter receptor subunit TctC
VLARSIANEASTQLAQPFVLDTRGGANGIIGTDIVAKAAPDGYTLLYVTASFVINPHIYVKLPYKGVAPALNAVMAGQVQLTLIPPTIALAQVKAGRVRAIAFTGASRFAGLPQLPTMSEAGVANVELTGAWQGFFAPARTLLPAMARLQQELARALQSPKVREHIIAGGYEPDGRSGAAFATFLRAEYERYGEMVRAANIS